ncbi:MAG: flippase [Bacteroidota bacterium]
MKWSNGNIWNNSILLLISRVLAKLATMGVVVVTARCLGVEGFGIFNSVIAVSMFAGIVSEFGLMMPTIRSISNSDTKDGSVVVRSLSFRIIASAGACILTVFAGWYVALDPLVILILSIASVFELNGTTLIRSFEGVNDFRLVSVYTVIERLLYGSIVIISALLFRSVTALSIGILLADSIYVAVAYSAFQRRFGRITFVFTVKDLREYALMGLPFLLTTVFSNVYYKIDTILIGHLASMQDVGIYNAGMRILDAQMMVPITVMTSVFPQLSLLFHQRSAEYGATVKKYLLFMTSAGIIFSVLTFAVAGVIVPLLYSESYTNAINILQILSLMLVFFFINALLFQTLISMHKELVFTGIMLFSAAASLILNVLLIPRYGIVASAWVRVAIESSTCIFAGAYIFSRLSSVSVQDHNAHERSGIHRL